MKGFLNMYKHLEEADDQNSCRSQYLGQVCYEMLRRQLSKSERV